jgi:hypothetical protein
MLVSDDQSTVFPIPSKSAQSFKSKSIVKAHLDQLLEGAVNWRTERLDILPEIHRGNSALGDAFRGELEFL